MNHYPADMTVNDLPDSPALPRMSYAAWAHEHPDAANDLDRAWAKSHNFMDLMAEVEAAPDMAGALVTRWLNELREYRRRTVADLGVEIVERPASVRQKFEAALRK